VEDTLIKQQEEFEKLLSELARLKSINELTERNTENASNVISQIDIVIKSTQEYKNKIDEDYSLKSEKLNALLSTLENTLVEINSHSKDIGNVISNSFTDYSNKTKENIDAKLLVQQELLKKVLVETTDVKSLFERNSSSIKELIQKVNNDFNNKTEQSNAQFKTIKTLLIVTIVLLIVLFLFSFIHR
jgi:chromosome segregation ATPase